jgi:TonB family protein
MGLPWECRNAGGFGPRSHHRVPVLENSLKNGLPGTGCYFGHIPGTEHTARVVPRTSRLAADRREPPVQGRSLIQRTTAALAVVALAVVANAEPRPARLVGCVVDGLGNSMPGVAIELGRDSEWAAAGTTDNLGCFILEKPIDFSYRVRFRARGFVVAVRHVSSASREYDFGKVAMEVAPISLPVEIPVHPSSLQRTTKGPRTSAESLIAWEPRRIVAPERYPKLAGMAGTEGIVEVRCMLAEDGTVLSADAISGHPLLRAGAVENAKQWQFRPISSRATTAPREVNLFYAFELVGSPAQREPKTRFSFDYPNRVRLTTEPRCADHAPCPTEEIAPN